MTSTAGPDAPGDLAASGGSGVRMAVAAMRGSGEDTAVDDVAALVEQARGGSQAAFATLVERFQPPIRAYLARLLDDDEHARDLAQEVFARAWRKLHELRQPEYFRAWVYRIATNQAHSALRRRRAVRWVSLDRLHSAPLLSTPDAEATAPEQAALRSRESGFEERIARTEMLNRALRAVPVSYRTSLLLYLTHGFSVAEIAEQLGVSHAAVRSRLSRGLAMLRDAYARENA
ncbi:MAG: hypothetical protein OJF49_002265 [Ktedonobacterales bacterium]|jgi:RNA polymerase sigma-70 factor (ECF subfamily)|nr:MAG: hypothetical protein OJF49_002265 [Ktedonobacterales bacterium]